MTLGDWVILGAVAAFFGLMAWASHAADEMDRENEENQGCADE